MRAWFVALAASIWVIVVAAGILLLAGVGFCYHVSDPSLANRSVCSTVETTWYFDIMTLIVGIPVLILIDHVVRNPSWWDRPLTRRVMHFWLTLTTIVALFFTLAIVQTELFQVILGLWLGIGLTLAALFIIGTKGSSILPED
jgi:hypothetical protein